MTKEDKAGRNSMPKNAKEGRAVNETEKIVAGKKQFGCDAKGCKGKVGFGSAQMLAVHKHLAHGD